MGHLWNNLRSRVLYMSYFSLQRPPVNTMLSKHTDSTFMEQAWMLEHVLCKYKILAYFCVEFTSANSTNHDKLCNTKHT